MRVPHGSASSICGELMCGFLTRIHRSAEYDPDPGLTGLLSFRDSMDPNIRWETVDGYRTVHFLSTCQEGRG